MSSYFFPETPGCGVGFAQISELTCTYPSAYLASENYPSLYTPNTKYSWRIEVEFGKFVALDFITFDISTIDMLCLTDRLEIHVINREGEIKLIAR